MIEWRAVPGYEGIFEVSNTGLVRSLDRTHMFVRPDGAEIRRHVKGRLMSARTRGDSPYLRVGLRIKLPGADLARETLLVHRAVLMAFVGPQPFESAQGCHIDGDPLNNHASNLYWGTPVENMADMRRHGRGHEQKRTHCPHRHEYTPENTRMQYDKRHGSTIRICRTCERDWQQRYYAKQRGRTA